MTEQKQAVIRDVILLLQAAICAENDAEADSAFALIAERIGADLDQAEAAHASA